MSRSGYSDDINNWDLIRWRGAVNSAIRGKRGQEFLRELIAALDAMPEKKLIAGEFEEAGQFCALGAVAHARGLNPAELNPTNRVDTAARLGIAEALAAEIMDVNDGYWYGETTAEQRWRTVREWAEKRLKNEQLD